MYIILVNGEKIGEYYSKDIAEEKVKEEVRNSYDDTSEIILAKVIKKKTY